MDNLHFNSEPVFPFQAVIRMPGYFNIVEESKMNDPGLEKGKVSIIVEIIEYVPDSVVIKTIIDKTTGKISAASFDSGETLTDRLSRFDNFIQIIDGEAEVIMMEAHCTWKLANPSLFQPIPTIQSRQTFALRCYRPSSKAATKMCLEATQHYCH